MTRQSNAVQPSQFREAKPTALGQDLARLSFEVRAQFDSIRARLLERWTPAKESIRSRAVLKFGEAPKVDTSGASVPLLLPRATPADAGQRIVFFKVSAANSITLRSADSVQVNRSATASITALGRHEVWWDGTEWWT